VRDAGRQDFSQTTDFSTLTPVISARLCIYASNQKGGCRRVHRFLLSGNFSRYGRILRSATNIYCKIFCRAHGRIGDVPTTTLLN